MIKIFFLLVIVINLRLGGPTACISADHSEHDQGYALPVHYFNTNSLAKIML